MEFSFEAKAVIHLVHHKEQTTSVLKAVDVNLDVSKNLDRKQYLDREDLPTKNGSHVLTNVLVSGLAANIKHAHANGYRDEVEHIKYAIEQLTRQFAENAEVGKSYFKDL